MAFFSVDYRSDLTEKVTFSMSQVGRFVKRGRLLFRHSTPQFDAHESRLQSGKSPFASDV
jgi:hypothetical protein